MIEGGQMDKASAVFWLVLVGFMFLVFWLLGPVPETFQGARGR